MDLRQLSSKIIAFWILFSPFLRQLNGAGLQTGLLLLDFEKAHDRVVWDFLEGGTLSRMGFMACWITGVSALYRHSSSAIAIGGYVGPSFMLSRSVWQGCLLAPYVFLFYAETMLVFLRASITHIHGILLPLSSEEELLDSEFTDDWRLWISERSLLSSLAWDPDEWSWLVARTREEPVSFFEYTVRVGRQIMLRQQPSTSTRLRVWLHAGLSHAFLSFGASSGLPCSADTLRISCG